MELIVIDKSGKAIFTGWPYLYHPRLVRKETVVQYRLINYGNGTGYLYLFFKYEGKRRQMTYQGSTDIINRMILPLESQIALLLFSD